MWNPIPIPDIPDSNVSFKRRDVTAILVFFMELGQRVRVKFRPQISKQSFMSSAPTVNASSQEAHICPTKKLYKVHPTFENCPLDWESNTSTEYNNKSKDTRTKVVLARILEKQGLGGTPVEGNPMKTLKRTKNLRSQFARACFHKCTPGWPN